MNLLQRSRFSRLVVRLSYQVGYPLQELIKLLARLPLYAFLILLRVSPTRHNQILESSSSASPRHTHYSIDQVKLP